MKLIPLTQGLFAKVDDEDYEYLNQFKWMATKVRTTFYAIRNVQINGKWKHLSMHREIMQTPDDMETDHKDWDGCNNQRHNMRN